MAELFEKIQDPVFQAVVGLCCIPALLIGAYIASLYVRSWAPLYFGIVVGAILAFPALVLLIALFLLWKNPEKYKEREMKRRLREREKREQND